jgi:hypothetical protein
VKEDASKASSKMAFAPKKDGGPNLKFYESHETLLLFEGVKTWLIKNCKKVNIHRQQSPFVMLILRCHLTGSFPLVSVCSNRPSNSKKSFNFHYSSNPVPRRHLWQKCG